MESIPEAEKPDPEVIRVIEHGQIVKEVSKPIWNSHNIWTSMFQTVLKRVHEYESVDGFVRAVL